MHRFDALNELYLFYKDIPTINVYVMGIGMNNSIPVTEITSGNDLPWVKSGPNCDIWSDWGAVNRDLFIMNQSKDIISKINLSSSFDDTQIKFIIENLINN